MTEYVVVKSIGRSSVDHLRLGCGRNAYLAMAGYSQRESSNAAVFDVKWRTWYPSRGDAILFASKEEAERMAFAVVISEPDSVGRIAIGRVFYYRKNRRWALRVL